MLRLFLNGGSKRLEEALERYEKSTEEKEDVCRRVQACVRVRAPRRKKEAPHDTAAPDRR